MSNVELALRWGKAVVIIAVTVWELVLLARRRDDLSLRVLVVGLICLSWAATVGIKTPLLEPVRDLFGEAWRHVINGSWSVMAFSFATYFLLANPAIARSRRVRQALIELGLLVVALVAMVVAHDAAPPETWSKPMSAEDYRSPWNLVWCLSVDGYALIVWFTGVRRADALRRRLRNPWGRAAFWLVMVGSAAMTLGVNAISVLRQIMRCFDPGAGKGGVLSVLYSTGQLGGQFVLAIGLALVPLATAVAAAHARRVRRQRRKYARQLEPLWRTLTGEFPYISLHTAESEQRDGGFDRSTAEITDGLAELARDCPPEPTGDVRDPHVAAEIVAAGLAGRAERRATGAEPDHEPPYPRIEPDFPSWRARARWMVDVSEDLRGRGLLVDQEPARVG